MIVIGLTGGIGMGKSSLAAQLEKLGARVCSADAIVHMLLGKNGAAVPAVGKRFPGVVKNNAVDRRALGAEVFSDHRALKALEKILHPLVVKEENRFIERERRKGHRVAVLEIPLLFETKAEKRCDLILVASASASVQRQRVMKRPGMTKEKFERILALQMPDREKRKRADVVINTGLGKRDSMKKLKELMEKLHA